MRSSKAKKIRLALAIEAYAGDDVSVEDVKKGIKDVYAEKQFKSMARAKKKNAVKHDIIVHHKISSRQQRLKAAGKEKRWPIPEPGEGKRKKLFRRAIGRKANKVTPLPHKVAK